MTGPEHYREGEALLGTIDAVTARAQRDHMPDAAVGAAVSIIVAQAQAHFTAALVAATIEASAPGGAWADDAWIKAIR